MGLHDTAVSQLLATSNTLNPTQAALIVRHLACSAGIHDTLHVTALLTLKQSLVNLSMPVVPFMHQCRTWTLQLTLIGIPTQPSAHSQQQSKAPPPFVCLLCPPGVHDTVVNQLLTKIDGVDALNNILLIGMTNRKDMLVSGLLSAHGELLNKTCMTVISMPDRKRMLVSVAAVSV